MRAFTINPHRRPSAYELEDAGRPTVRTLVLALCGMWIAALLLGAVGFRAEYGVWPPTFQNGALLPLAYGVIALPAAVMIFPLLGLLFWPLVLGLQVAACYHRRWIYLVPLVLLVAPAAWGWTVAAVAMTSI